MQTIITFKEEKFLGMQELADKFGCHRVTLSRYIKKLRDQIPHYRLHQKNFGPVQYKKIAELLGFEI